MSEVVAAENCYFTAILMFLIQLGAGLAGIAMLSHGISYLDDNVDKSSSAALIGKMRHSLRGTGRHRRAQNLRLIDLNARKHTTDTQINTPTNA
jgi:hypothetical protein